MPRPWYHAGLEFECTRCGRCCRGPGIVRVRAEDERALAELLGIEIDRFRRQYTHVLGDGSRILRETPEEDCVFFDQRVGCTVYSARPLQCRTWPFWKSNVASPDHWEIAGRTCPGIGRGPRVSAARIHALASDDGTTGIVPELREGPR